MEVRAQRDEQNATGDIPVGLELVAFPAKALTTVAFALLSESGKRILLRIFVAYHDALVGQTRFETEARSK
jgi:hypothetical protein